MSCFSELTYSIFVDGELAAEEARRVESHLTECSTCRDLVQALTTENRIVSAALAAPLAVDAPASVTVRGMAREFIAVVIVLATAGTALHWLAEALPANLDWLNPLTTDGRMNLFLSIVFYLRQAQFKPWKSLLGQECASIVDCTRDCRFHCFMIPYSLS